MNDTIPRTIISRYEVKQLPGGSYGMFYAGTDLRAYAWRVWPTHKEAESYRRRIEGWPDKTKGRQHRWPK